MQTDKLIEFIRETAKGLKCSSLKGYDPEDREIIRAEENGYDIMADTLIAKLRNGTP